MKFNRHSLRLNSVLVRPERLRLLGAVAALNLVFISACGAEDEGPDQGITRPPDPSLSGSAGGGVINTKPTGSASGPDAISDLTGDFVQAPTGTPTSTGNVSDQCASSSNPTELKGVTLVFAFDKSASMGSTTEERGLKWAPVVEATKAFFANPASTDVSAQLTLFPSESAPGYIIDEGVSGDEPNPAACEAPDYAMPDFPLTVLPTADFGTYIDGIEPDRLSTPTQWALEGVLQQATGLRETTDTNIAIVLVTDGLPTNCGQNPGNVPIGDVADVAADAFAAGFPVYVIGVESPPGIGVGGGGNGLANLTEIADAGGTEEAFVIDTGDVAATVTQFGEVIEAIKEAALACNLPIPDPPAGQAFDKNKVNVDYTVNGGEKVQFVHDPTCMAENAWKYDDEENPQAIVLCDSNCEKIKGAGAGVTGSIDVQLGCQTRPPGTF